MATEELEKYQELYNKFVSRLADLHNRHLDLVKMPSNEDASFDVRGIFLDLQKMCKPLRDSTKLVCAEGRGVLKELKAKRAIAKERNRLLILQNRTNAKQKGQKYGKHKRTTQTTSE